MSKRKREAPPGRTGGDESSGASQGFSRGTMSKAFGGRRAKRGFGLDEDEDDRSKAMLPGMEDAVLTDSEDEAHDSDDDAEEDEQEGGKKTKKKKPEEEEEEGKRDREIVHTARLKKQGIRLDADDSGIAGAEGEDGVDAEEFQEYLGHRADSSGSSGTVVISKRKSDSQSGPRESEAAEELERQRITRIKAEKLFGKSANDVNLVPFSMNDEGYFNEEGKFVKGEAVHDAWFDEWEGNKTKDDYKKPKISDKTSVIKSKEDALYSNDVMLNMDALDLRRILLKHMKPGEDVFAALKRIKPKPKAGAAENKAKQPTKMKNQRKKTPSWMETDDKKSDSKEGEDEASSQQLKAFNELTDAAQSLLAQGFYDVYEHTYERVAHMVRSQEVAEEKKREWEAKQRARREEEAKQEGMAPKWEYKWNAQDKQVHGPFSAEDMTGWRADGYFDDKVVIRRVGQNHWLPSAQIKSFSDSQPPQQPVSASSSSSASSSTSSEEPSSKKHKLKF